MSKLVVFVDAGHGKYTQGKRTPDDTLREFHFNSVVADKVGRWLVNEYEDVEVYYTYDKTGETDTPLSTRTATANKIYNQLKGKAENFVFVSVHANAYGDNWNSAGGIETFAYTTKPAKSTQLATYVQQELIANTGLANRGVKFADFAVLRETAMDAILCECGFMTNKVEADLLKSNPYREKVAMAIINGLCRMYGVKRKPAPAPTSAPVAPQTAQPAPVNQANDGLLYRVVTGSYDNKANADEQVAKLKKAGFDSFVLPYHK